jgi:transitional endoplasmic reticulum ATPase
MKIQRVETRSFAISEGAEKRLERKLSRGTIKNAVNRLIFKEKTELIKSYKPLAKFRVSRLEQVQKGVIGEQTMFETRQNNFYVDLSNGDLYMAVGHEIKRADILRKIMNLSPTAVRLLGELMRRSFVYVDEVDKGSLMDLAHLGYTSIYKSTMLMFFKGLWEELTPEDTGKTVVKDRAKATIHIPRFHAKCYDLSNHLIEIDTIDELYAKDNIKLPIDTVSQLLINLFDAKVALLGVTFMPYITAHYTRAGGHKIKSPKWHFPVSFAGDILGTKRKEGKKLKPISLSTSISAEGSVPIEESTIDFSDVGGMDELKKEIQETIICPLTNPDLAKEFGKKCGGAILLYGPPGCGKTYIARATIGEVGLPFFNVNISEIVGRGVKAEAENLHEVFDEARKNAPAVIFFDEIDAIGGRREGVMGYEEKMEVDQFLMEMDGVESMGKDILIIASTNSPWNIDPALRRSARFTKQIFVPPPDAKGREQIFRIHTREKPISDGVDFTKLAEMTEDYAASDIKAICDGAAEIPWQAALGGEASRKICMDDFLTAIKKQKPSLIPWFKMAHNELKKKGEEKFFEDFAKYISKYGGGVDRVEKPEIDFSDVGGMENVKEEVRKAVIYPLKNPAISRDFKKEVGGSILLYGPPGCGKTYIARATAGECDVAFFNVKLTDILSEAAGESERNIQGIFERASSNTPAILFFDEIDAITGRRDATGSESGKRLIDAFLTEMDGFTKTSGLVIIAATNAPWNIDPALRRSERFSKQVFVPPPDAVAREQIFRIHAKKKPVSMSVDYRELAELSAGYSSSDIKAVCDLAIEIPWQEALKGGKERGAEMSDFKSVINTYKTSLSPWYAAAEKLIRESGEAEFYKDLAENITDFRLSAMKPKGTEFEKVLQKEKKNLGMISEKDLKEVLDAKEEIERKIEMVRKKYHKRELDDAMFKEILGEYEKQLIEYDVKTEILKSKRADTVKELPEVLPQTILERGQIHLIKEKEPTKSIELFLQEAESMPALWISRTNAAKIRKDYDITDGNITVLWLTASLSDNDAVSPLTPQLFAVLTDFVAGNKERKVILLEGIEYLIAHNGFGTMLNMLQGFKDKISLTDTTVLVPVSPGILDDREMTLLEKETKQLL